MLLDLSPILEGSDASVAFATRSILRTANKWGYYRYWLAEHHNLPSIASPATAVVIGYVAGGTKTIRVGAGGIMLPNHAPLIVAEQFGTLESLYPGRIDLALGRAPGRGSGNGARVAALLRKRRQLSGRSAGIDVLLSCAQTRPTRDSIPGAGTARSDFSSFSARTISVRERSAAELGLPFGFASHFAPDYLHTALEIYRREFKPSPDGEKPYVIVGAGLYAADSDEEALRIFIFGAVTNVEPYSRQSWGKLPPPNEKMDDLWSPAERDAIAHRDSLCCCRFAQYDSKKIRGDHRGNPMPTKSFFTAQIFDHAARLRSFEIGADVAKQFVT